MDLKQKVSESSLSQIILVKDKTRIFTPAWTKFTGREMSHLEEDGWHELVHPDDNEYCCDVWAEIIESKPNHNFEARIKRIDGEYRYFYITTTSVVYKEEQAILANFQDITDSDASKRQNFKDLERFMDQWKHDPQGLCSFVGKAMGRISHRHVPDLFFSIGTSYFAYKEICSRIDFLYDHYEEISKGQKARILRTMVCVDKQDEIVCLHNIRREVRNPMHLMLLRDEWDEGSGFSVRPYVLDGKPSNYLAKIYHRTNSLPIFSTVAARQSYVDFPLFLPDISFWNFMCPCDCLHGVKVPGTPENSLGFFDVKETQRVAELIIEGSNLVGWR
mgnify:CR=1 FL=1